MIPVTDPNCDFLAVRGNSCAALPVLFFERPIFPDRNPRSTTLVMGVDFPAITFNSTRIPIRGQFEMFARHGIVVGTIGEETANVMAFFGSTVEIGGFVSARPWCC
jgi:hypothetical protein